MDDDKSHNDVNFDDPGCVRMPADEKQLIALASKMRKNEPSQQILAQRESTRFQMSPTAVSALIEHVGGGESHCFVGIFDLSENGAGFLYRGYLHTDSKVQLQLIAENNQTVSVEGHVRWCQYMRDTYHIVGIKFTKKIDPRRFVDPSEWMTAQQSIKPEQNEDIGGCILLHEPDQLVKMLIHQGLESLPLEINEAPDIGSLIDNIKIKPYDVLLLGTQSNKDDVNIMLERVSRLRMEGFCGAVILLSTLVDDDILKKSSTHGVSQVVEKPFQIGSLIAIIRSMISDQTDFLAGSQPLYPNSTAGLPDEAVLEYISAVQQQIESIMNMAKNDDLVGVRGAVNGLYSTGDGFGFNVLSKAAQSVLTKLNASSSVEESLPAIRQLGHVVFRLQVVNTTN